MVLYLGTGKEYVSVLKMKHRDIFCAKHTLYPIWIKRNWIKRNIQIPWKVYILCSLKECSRRHMFNIDSMQGFCFVFRGDKDNLQWRTTENAYYRAHSCGGCQLTKLTEFGYIKYNVLGYSRVINWAFGRPAWNNQTTVLTANASSLN